MGKSEEQTAIRLLRDLVDLQNGAPLERDREIYESTMQEIYDFLNYVESPNYTDSQSPTESVIEKSSNTEFDTLQLGDWFIGTVEECSMVSSIWKYSGLKLTIIGGCCIVGKDGSFYGVNNYYPDIPEKKTQLTAPEFIRRAENTFKTK